MWKLILILIYVATVSSAKIFNTRTHTAFDIFAQRLQLEAWDKDEAPCLENTLTLLENVKNFTLWATWIWNANALPMGNLYGSLANFGNFDQCMKPPWLDTHPDLRTKYCIAEMHLSDKQKKVAKFDPYGSTEEFLNTPTITGIPVNLHYWGVCVPAACEPPAVSKIVRSMYNVTTFGTRAPDIKVDYCQVAGEEIQYSTQFYLFLLLIAALIVTAVASTYYRSYIATDVQPPDCMETIITKSFCLNKNRQDLMKQNKEEIGVMNGMRVITAFIVVYIHEIFYMVISGMANPRDFDKVIEGVPGLIMLHIDVVVDTFFAMSGLLHIKGLLANRDKHQNLFMVLWKRYIRLIGPFAVIIFYLTSVSMYVDSGPVWHVAREQEADVCQKNWRLSLLMINSDVKDLCHVVTWSLSCDYQLAILGTVLFYFYQKDRRLGAAAFGTAAVFSMLIPGILTYWYRIPAIPFLDLGKLIQNQREYWEISRTYTPSYARAGSYLVGIAMGYLMTVYKPAENRKKISKKWSTIGTAVSLAAMVSVLSLGQTLKFREYDPLLEAVVAATNRIVWAAAICCIIGFCEYGTVPVVSSFLSQPFFTPLSRLSYGLYMIHPLVIQINKFSLRHPWKYSAFTVFTIGTGSLTISLALSFVMWLLVEAPVINLSNHLLFTKSASSEPSKEPAKNGIHHQNGQMKTKAL